MLKSTNNSMYKFSILLLLVIMSSCTTSKSITDKTKEIKSDDNSVKYASTINAEELKEHLYVLASDKYQGRETGRIGQKMSAEYIEKEFKKDGVSPGNKGKYYQTFELIEKTAPRAYINYGGNTFYYIKDFYFFPYFKEESFSFRKNDMYDLGYGIIDGDHDDYGKLDVKNKVVIVRKGQPESIEKKWKWIDKLKIAQEKGVKAIFIVDDNNTYNTYTERLSHFLTGTSMELKKENTEEKEYKYIPFFFIKQDVYTAFLAESEGPERLESDTDDLIEVNIERSENTITSENVLGYIEGSDPVLKNELIVITAHYDHLGIKEDKVYNGADDDGSGTVALLEIAEAFAKAKTDGNGAKRSVLVMPVSGEEKGLLGSSYYASNPVFPLENTVVDLNVDMIGRIDSAHTGNPNYVYLIGSDILSTDLHNLSEQINKTYTKMELDYTYRDINHPERFYFRSDHYNFAKNNIPVIFYFNGVHEDYHEHTDTVDKINFDKIEKTARLIFHTAWEIANRKERLKLNDTK